MARVQVQVEQDHLERITKKSPLKGIAELVWNSLDGDSASIKIEMHEGPLGNIKEIHVIDDGTGISHNEALKAFKSLGASWKRCQRTSPKGRILHGKDGEGRFSAYSIGNEIRWISRFKQNGKVKQFEILGNAKKLREFDVKDPVDAKGQSTGTEVIISQIEKPIKPLTSEDTILKLAKIFATYLHQYPQVHISLDQESVDSTLVVHNLTEYPINDCVAPNGQPITAQLTIVEWKTQGDRELCLCDSDGFTLAIRQPGIQAKGFHFSTYLKSELVGQYHKDGVLELEGLPPDDLNRLIEASKDVMRNHFRQQEAKNSQNVVNQWKKDDIYPYANQPSRNVIEEAERQVFDIVALNINEYLPDFATSDPKSKRLSFQMLKTALEKSPSEVRRIVQEVLELPKEKMEDLIELLDKTSLASIISASKLVLDRLQFLDGLEVILFDPKTKNKLLERQELHRILAENTWIFGEEFHLTVNDEGLTKVLERHLQLLGQTRTNHSPVKTARGTPGIVDLMLSRSIPQSKPDQFEHLVIELKRPNVKIDEDVVNQLKKYAKAVAADDRFRNTNTRWTFIAVSNELSEGVTHDYFNQKDRPDGIVLNKEKPAMKMLVKTWGQIISACRSRLKFIQDSLNYTANPDRSFEHLRKTYSKYLSSITPFEPIEHSKVKPFINAVPLYDFRISAGTFGPTQEVREVPSIENYDKKDFIWVSPKAQVKLNRDHFVAQVVGESMNRRAKNGAYCLFKRHSAGNCRNRPVIVRHKDISDPDLGQYTFKIFDGEREILGDETSPYKKVVLKPDSTDKTIPPIILEDIEESEFRIVAEFVATLE